MNRCVQRNYGFIGCGIDRGDEVLAITDKMCSGRHNCTIRVPNAFLDDAAKRANCPDDFKSYLDVSYECVSGKNAASTDNTLTHGRIRIEIVQLTYLYRNYTF